MLTGSQYYLSWHKAILALDRKIGAEARLEPLKDVFAQALRHGGNTYTFKGDVLLSLLHLTLHEYLGFLQPSFLLAYEDLAGFARLKKFAVGLYARKYLLSACTGELREPYLDPTFH